MIPLFHPAILKEEWLEGLGKLFDGKHIAQGQQCDRFEREFGRKFDYRYCLSTNSASSALELAYELLDLKPGDEVLGPVLTCVATYLPLLRKGVKVTLVDVNSDFQLHPIDLLYKLKRTTKAIINVNIGGIATDPAIVEIAKLNNIPLVIDAAQSLGIKEPHGDFVVYSFQAIKHFTTGDGGMLVCRRKADYSRAKKLRWFGIDRDKRVKSGYRATTLDADEPGFKFQMNDIAAVMGRIGLKHSNRFLRHRRTIAKIYDESVEQSNHGGSNWLYSVNPSNRKAAMETLRKYGIESNLVHTRLDNWKIFGGKRQELTLMDAYENYYLYIPIHQNITLKEAYRVAKVLNGLNL